jgi:hypothetical protein
LLRIHKIISGIGLLKTVGSANIIIIVAVIAASIVALLILIVVIILICRKKKPTDKCKLKQKSDKMKWQKYAY